MNTHERKAIAIALDRIESLIRKFEATTYQSSYETELVRELDEAKIALKSIGGGNG